MNKALLNFRRKKMEISDWYTSLRKFNQKWMTYLMINIIQIKNTQHTNLERIFATFNLLWMSDHIKVNFNFGNPCNT